MDQEIGKILDTLKSQNIADDTLIIFISDNGGSTPIYANNGPLRGSKYTLDEGGIRVPMIVSWSGKIEAQQTMDNVISTMDIFPSIASIVGSKITNEIDGSDISKLWLGIDKTLMQETLVWDTHYEYAVRSGKWKLKVVHSNEHAKYEMVNLKLGTHLFNLENDKSEANNLASDHPEIVTRLKKIHQQWRIEMADPVGI